jgi:hypothetical protein
MERVGILLIGLAALVYVSAHAYIDISYMLMDKNTFYQIP